MTKKTIIFSVVVLVLSVFFHSALFAECTDGKSEVLIVTPSGKEKIICISDNAIPGLENAAEHSDGVIIPSSCPCWDEAEIESYVADNILKNCVYRDEVHILICQDYDDKLILEAGKAGNYCTNYLTQEQSDKTFGTEQWNACSSLVEAYLDETSQ